MIYLHQIPEEYRAITLWERPIGTIKSSSRLLSAQFVPNCAIYPEGAVVTLLILERPSETPLAVFDICREIKAFEICLFDLIHHDFVGPASILVLRKESNRERTIALPNSLVQVELG